VEGQPTPIDVARVQIDGSQRGQIERVFGNGIGIGFDTLVNIEAAKLPVSGFAGYGIATLRTILLHFHRPNVRIEADDQQITQPCLMISVMNGRRMGGGFLMAPESSSNDGLLDICVARAVSRLTILSMVPRFLRGTQAGHRAIRFLRSRMITVTALQGKLPVHADGETICEDASRVEVTILPGAVSVLRGL
jgi:diacylglycerol kinase family enzyme